MKMPVMEKVNEAVQYIRTQTDFKPDIGLILGSGLGSFAETLEQPVGIPTSEIPNYPRSTVSGHEGKLIFGWIGNKKIIAIKGRVHYYEGYCMESVTFSVRVMHELGVRSLIVTNAAGAVNPQFSPGDLMLITSHINFFFDNPLCGPNDDNIGQRFPDMEEDYDRRYIQLAERTALALKIRTQRGVYCASSGPTYETRAEVKMFQRLGADAVGMSTVPEVIVARYYGMRVLGISCITNLGTGISPVPLSHEEVTETANRIKKDFENLLHQIILQM